LQDADDGDIDRRSAGFACMNAGSMNLTRRGWSNGSAEAADRNAELSASAWRDRCSRSEAYVEYMLNWTLFDSSDTKLYKYRNWTLFVQPMYFEEYHCGS
jgi:hypothetical protein